MKLRLKSDSTTRPGMRVGLGLAALFAFAGCDASAPSGSRVERPSFNGERAYQYVVDQVRFGPRVPGTEGHAVALDWIASGMAARAGQVTLQRFDVETTTGDTLRLTNILARFNPEAERRLLLFTHWDTRPQSDQAQTEEDRAKPVPGANDGASGTAVLMELAEMFQAQPPEVGVDMLFVDGEDYGPTSQDMFFGSIHFAEQLPEDEYPVYAVLLDMVGDIDPSFPIEGYSADGARGLAMRVWEIARDLGYEEYFPTRVGQRVADDHLPLLQKGIRAINIIDFSYGPNHSYWHTPEDNVQYVSAETLGMVGEVVAEWVYRGG